MRMIDADALKSKLMITTNTAFYSDYCNGYCDARKVDLDAIDAAPTIEPKVRQGRWIPLQGWSNTGIAKCSVCGNTLDMGGVNAGRGDANFCPNCGARMDGGDDNGNRV